LDREDGNGVGRELRRLADATGRLVREHVDLARVELKEDARRLASDAALGVVAIPFLLTAHLLLSAALALWIAQALGAPWAFALVGGGNLAAGAGLGIVAARRLRRDGGVELPATAEELRKDRAMMLGLQDGGRRIEVFREHR
jgi:uncharacterized membrane protein YqjE